MRRMQGALTTMGLAVAIGCGGAAPEAPAPTDVDWFDGDLAAALQEADADDTIVMADFFTEW